MTVDGFKLTTGARTLGSSAFGSIFKSIAVKPRYFHSK